MRRHTLLIDADDTLWENNVFFEKLIEDFISRSRISSALSNRMAIPAPTFAIS